MKIFVHIGLPKTGTTAIQDLFFKGIADDKFFYNPPEIAGPLKDVLADYEINQVKMGKLKDAVIAFVAKKNNSGTLLVSNESIGFPGWNPNFKYGFEVAKEAFPNAHILVFLRKQFDLLVSIYRHAVDADIGKTFNDFLRVDNGFASFDINNLDYSSGETVHTAYDPLGCRQASVDPFSLNYNALLSAYFGHFGKKNVSVFFYEEFKRDNEAVIRKLAEIMNVSKYEYTRENLNVSPSALFINLVIMKDRLHHFLNVKRNRDVRKYIVKRDEYLERCRAHGEQRSKIYSFFLVLRYGDFPMILRTRPFQFINRLDWSIIDPDVRAKLVSFYKRQNNKMNEELMGHSLPAAYL